MRFSIKKLEITRQKIKDRSTIRQLSYITDGVRLLVFLVDTYMRTKCRRQLEQTKYTLLNSIFDENCPSLVLF